MDIISHGLWGSIAFGRKNKISFWKAFLFGIAPDLLSFGPFFVLVFLGIQSRPTFSSEPPDPSQIPLFVHRLYSVTHSLIVFAVLFFLLWLIFKKPVWESYAWGLHILLDIPTHSYKFFPTPFLWPVSGFEVNGRAWATPEIFIPNVVLLLSLYAWYWYYRYRKSRN